METEKKEPRVSVFILSRIWGMYGRGSEHSKNEMIVSNKKKDETIGTNEFLSNKIRYSTKYYE